ncbi:MAG: anthranilate synthase component I family protein, partial [Gemmatimonadaceae bacterium]
MSFDEFRTRAEGGGMIPVWRDCLLDTDTPVSAFAKLRRGPFAFLLESAPAGSETWSRYTFLGTEPRGAWRLHDGIVEDWSPQRGWYGARCPADPLADLRALIDAYQPADVPELGAFWSGAVGYFSYDVVRLIEKLPNTPPAGPRVPDGIFVFTRAVVIIDNLRSQARVVVGVPVDRGTSVSALRALHAEAIATIDETIDRLRAPHSLPALDLSPDAPPATGISSYERSAFVADVEKIREYIFAGDAFQVLLARRIVVPHDFPAEALYRALRALNPSPYMYFLDVGDMQVVGSSPEILVRLRDGKITIRPIAGTRPRGATPEQDLALEKELLADPKERAEHIMLVDLHRNDIG